MLSPFARGVLTGLTLSLATLSTLAYAASGGLFGDILAKILGITPAQVLTYTGNGTVANSARIGGLDATQFQRVLTNQTCPPGQCIRGYDASNNYTPICGN